jgi:hypothetical protein
VPPQGLLAAEAVFQAPDRHPMGLKVYIVDRGHQGFAHAQPVMIDEAKERAIPGRVDGAKEAPEFILGEVFG